MYIPPYYIHPVQSFRSPCLPLRSSVDALALKSLGYLLHVQVFRSLLLRSDFLLFSLRETALLCHPPTRLPVSASAFSAPEPTPHERERKRERTHRACQGEASPRPLPQKRHSIQLLPLLSLPVFSCSRF